MSVTEYPTLTALMAGREPGSVKVRRPQWGLDALEAAERERDEAREQHRKARALAQSYWLELALIKNHGSDDASVLKARAAAALEET